MKSLWPVFGLLLAMSFAHPLTPAECIILWTGEVFRSWIRVFVYTSQPTYYYPPLTPVYHRYPQHGGHRKPVRPKPTTAKPGQFWPGTWIPWNPGPGRVKPTTSRTIVPKPTTSRTVLPVPTTSRTTVPEATTLMPKTTQSTTPTTTAQLPVTFEKTSTERPTEANLIPERPEMTKTRFFNMTCGNCPPKKQCLCPGVHF